MRVREWMDGCVNGVGLSGSGPGRARTEIVGHCWAVPHHVDPPIAWSKMATGSEKSEQCGSH